MNKPFEVNDPLVAESKPWLAVLLAAHLPEASPAQAPPILLSRLPNMTPLLFSWCRRCLALRRGCQKAKQPQSIMLVASALLTDSQAAARVPGEVCAQLCAKTVLAVPAFTS